MTGVETACLTIVGSILCGMACFVWGGKNKASQEDLNVIERRLGNLLTEDHHDRMCELKIAPIQSDVAEIRVDMKGVQEELKELRGFMGELRGDVKQVLFQIKSGNARANVK